ncbi:MAG: phage holin family protein [Ruminococcus sp.]|nr:phage holin family protein [Ruminococcus sp.]
MKETSLKAIIAVVCGGLSAYFGVIGVPLVVLFAAMCIDYLTGMTKAWVTGELSSRVGVLGIVKKVGYLVTVCVAAIVDWLLLSGLKQVGISIGMEFLFGMMVTIWFIVNECISILENLASIGVPLPKFLTAMIQRLAAVVDEKGEEKEE